MFRSSWSLWEVSLWLSGRLRRLEAAYIRISSSSWSSSAFAGLFYIRGLEYGWLIIWKSFSFYRSALIYLSSFSFSFSKSFRLRFIFLSSNWSFSICFRLMARSFISLAWRSPRSQADSVWIDAGCAPAPGFAVAPSFFEYRDYISYKIDFFTFNQIFWLGTLIEINFLKNYLIWN